MESLLISFYMNMLTSFISPRITVRLPILTVLSLDFSVSSSVVALNVMVVATSYKVVPSYSPLPPETTIVLSNKVAS